MMGHLLGQFFINGRLPSNTLLLSDAVGYHFAIYDLYCFLKSKGVMF